MIVVSNALSKNLRKLSSQRRQQWGNCFAKFILSKERGHELDKTFREEVNPRHTTIVRMAVLSYG